MRGKWRQAATTSCNEGRSPSEPPAGRRSSKERAKALGQLTHEVDCFQRPTATNLSSQHDETSPAMCTRAPGTLTLWLGAPAPKRLQNALHTCGGVVHQRSLGTPAWCPPRVGLSQPGEVHPPPPPRRRLSILAAGRSTSRTKTFMDTRPPASRQRSPTGNDSTATLAGEKQGAKEARGEGGGGRETPQG